MNTPMNQLHAAYAVYVSALAVEIYRGDQPVSSQGRFVCKQSNYLSILRFARNLALHRHLPLYNYAQAGG